MFKPLAMKHVMLQVLTDDLPQVALTLAGLGLFDPDFRPIYDDEFPRIPGERYREIYHQACSRLDKVKERIYLPDEPKLTDIRVI